MVAPKMIVDCHVNIWEPQHVSSLYREQRQKSRSAGIAETADADSIYREMTGVDRAIVFGLKYREAIGIEVPDEVAATAAQRYPDKLVGFACVNPTDPQALELLQHAHRNLGLRGVKMGPIYQGFHVLDPRAEPIYRYCQKNNLPVTLHMGTTFARNAPLDFGRPVHVDALALRYPELKIVMAHMGHPWEGECIAVFRKQPNVYSEISALHYRPWQFYNTLMLAQEYNVCHKIFFGTDYPFTTVPASIDGLKQVNCFTAGTSLPRVATENIDAILYSNPFEHWWHR